jgi:hypothetical protein
MKLLSKVDPKTFLLSFCALPLPVRVPYCS